MPSPLLNLATLALVASPAVATSSYNLLHKFDQTNFFQNFSFYSDPDPTDGFVKYLDHDAAHTAGLAKIKSNGNIYLGVDYTNTYTTGGRPSTRVMSDIQFDQGLLIADIAHMPGNACGVWPAFWTTGANWPADGEIDIIEGINKQKTTQVALHTLNSCDISTPASELSGELTATACSTDVGSGGCTVQGTEGSFGDDFNDLDGGIYAMELTSDGIKVWFFPRASIPTCITSGHPDTSAFGTPMAVFQGSCDFEKDFTAQQIIFNTDFCGDWAGYSYGSSCSVSDGSTAMASCKDYVGANPSAFTEAYWEIVSVNLYQKGNAAVSSAASTTAATSTAPARISPSAPTSAPTTAPTSTPTSAPTSAPTTAPTSAPTTAPTSNGSTSPSRSPIRSSPSGRPSSQPVAPSAGSRSGSGSGSGSSSGSGSGSGSSSGSSSGSGSGSGSSSGSGSGSGSSSASSSSVVGSAAGVSPATTPCSSKSTVTVTSTVGPSSAAPVVPTTSPCSSKSTVTVTSFTSPAPSVQAVSPASSKLTTTTVIVTSYVDVCPTGYTTKTITQTVTYCPADVTSSSITPAFTTTTKLCTSGCAPSPTAVVVVVPVETSTTPAKATGTALVSGSSPASGLETATLPALAVSVPGTSKTGVTTAISPIRTGIYSTGGLVPAAPSSTTGPAVAQPSSSLPGKGSVTSTGVSPAFTGAGSRAAPSAIGFIAAVAGFVLFI